MGVPAWVDLNRFVEDAPPLLPQHGFDTWQRGFMPHADTPPMFGPEPFFSDFHQAAFQPQNGNSSLPSWIDLQSLYNPGQPSYQEAGMNPEVMGRLPILTPGGAPSATPLPQGVQPRNQPGPGDRLIGPANPPIRPISPSSNWIDLNMFGREQQASLHPGPLHSNSALTQTDVVRPLYTPFTPADPGPTPFNQRFDAVYDQPFYQAQPLPTFNERFNSVYEQYPPIFPLSPNEVVSQGFMDLNSNRMPSFDMASYPTSFDPGSFPSEMASVPDYSTAEGRRNIGGPVGSSFPTQPGNISHPIQFPVPTTHMPPFMPGGIGPGGGVFAPGPFAPPPSYVTGPGGGPMVNYQPLSF